MKGFTFIELLVFVAIIAIFVAMLVVPKYQCAALWEDSGMKTKWGFFEGCRVQLPSGVWIPEKNYRDID